MIELLEDRRAEVLEMNRALDAAHRTAAREALLEHARMGRSVCEGGPGNTVVWVTPVEIFARYGFDEFGRPLPDAPPAG
jgi:hypothetical protein